MKSKVLKSANGTKVFWYSVHVLAFLVPLSQYLSVKMQVVACFFSFFAFTSKSRLSRFLNNAWDISLYLIVLVIGLLYSENIAFGWRVIETNLSFLTMAFIFSKFENEDSRLQNNLYYSFTIGLSLACLICLINALVVYGKLGDGGVFFFYSLTDIISFQPTYFAYYLIFSITYGLYLIYNQNDQKHTVLKLGGILFLFFVLMLTGGQTAYISMLLVFAFFILKFLIEEKTLVKKIMLVLVVCMLLCMFLTNLVTQKDNRMPLLSDSWDRLVLWESAINAVPNPLIGVGTGDYKAVLNQYYVDHGMEKFANGSYNSHNQFIQLLFSNGMLGVAALLLMISRPLYLSFKNQNILSILSLFPFLIYGITEVFLGRYQGVVFFAFLHQFFINQTNLKKHSLLVKPS